MTIGTGYQSKNNRDSKLSDDINFNLWVLLNHAYFVLARSRELEVAQYGLTREQAAVLHELIKKGGAASVAEIVDATMRQHHSVTTLINRMAGRGLVKKTKTSSTNRYLVSITEKGRSTFARVTRNSVQMALSDFSEEDKQRLAAYLKKLVDRGRNMLGMDYKPPFLGDSPGRRETGVP